MSYPPRASQLSRGWDLVNKPLVDFPSRLAKRGSEIISPHNEVGSPMRGFLSGALEGAGDLASSMTSPLSLGLTAMGLPWTRSMGSIPSSLGRIAETTMPKAGGIFSSMIPEWAAVGEEGAFNSARGGLFKPKSVEDLAYEVVRSGRDPIRRQIGGNFNVADMMAKTNSMRSR